MEYVGKVALVTGGGNGIGRATALAFAKNGARLIVVDRDEAAGEAVAAEIRQNGGEARFVAADVTQAADVQNYVDLALATYGRIDCFHNNAGIEGILAPIVDYDEAEFDRVMAINVKGVFLGLKYVLPVMLRQKWGAVVNSASVGALNGSPGLVPYTASKHAVLGITRTASSEVARQGVRVNAICPGSVETRMMQSLMAMGNPSDPEAASRLNAENTPTGRFSTPDEVAGLVLYLCSDIAANITGSHFVIDGGRTATIGPFTRY